MHYRLAILTLIGPAVQIGRHGRASVSQRRRVRTRQASERSQFDLSRAHAPTATARPRTSANGRKIAVEGDDRLFLREHGSRETQPCSSGSKEPSRRGGGSSAARSRRARSISPSSHSISSEAIAPKPGARIPQPAAPPTSRDRDRPRDRGPPDSGVPTPPALDLGRSARVSPASRGRARMRARDRPSDHAP